MFIRKDVLFAIEDNDDGLDEKSICIYIGDFVRIPVGSKIEHFDYFVESIARIRDEINENLNE